MYKRIIKFYYYLNPVAFVLVNYLLLLFILFVFFGIPDYFFNIMSGVKNEATTNLKPTELFITTVIVAPLLETFLFQYGIIKSIVYLSDNKYKTQAIILSAMAFTLIHSYSIIYMIYAFIMGLFFGILYFTSLKKKLYPFLVIAFVHALFNFTVFMVNR